LSFLTRPKGAFLIVALCMFQYVKQRQPLSRERIIAGTISAAYLICLYLYFGSMLPLAAIAKSAGYHRDAFIEINISEQRRLKCKENQNRANSQIACIQQATPKKDLPNSLVLKNACHNSAYRFAVLSIRETAPSCFSRVAYTVSVRDEI